MYKKGEILQHKNVVSVLMRVEEDVAEGIKFVKCKDIATLMPMLCHVDNVRKLG
jgi:hypothetical protein